MKPPTILLDTHAFLWAVLEPTKLGTVVRRWLDEPTNIPLVSIVSLWEISMKVQAGKLTLPSGRQDSSVNSERIQRWCSRALESLQARVLPIRAEHIYAFHKLPVHHKDAFDRILVAQAQSENALLATADKTLWERYDVELVW